MVDIDFSNKVSVFKALSDETRLKIVAMLSPDEEMCACEILKHFNVTQPTLSYHMKILTDCDLVDGRRDGAWMKYRINSRSYMELQTFLANLIPELSDADSDRRYEAILK
jgi:Predicted transcriptional regulators